MATRSMGSDPNSSLSIINLPVRKGDTPPEGWEGAEASECPVCKTAVWLHSSINEAMKAGHKRAMCQTCGDSERVRISRS